MLKHRKFLLLIFFLLGVGGVQGAMAQEPQTVPGTTVSMVPPDGFVPATSFAGFMKEEAQASVVIVEMPAEASAQLSQLFSDLETAKENFAAQKVAVEAREEITTSTGGTVPMLSGTQQASGVTYVKWIALFQGAKTVLITVQTPQDGELEAADVKTMLASVSLQDEEPNVEDKLAALPFGIEPAEPFRVIDTLGGSGVLMMAGELDVDPSGTQPMLIAVYQLSAPIDPNNLEAAAEQSLMQTRDFDTAQIEERRPVEFAGLDGIMLRGTHSDPSGGEKSFSQYMAIGDRGRFVRLLASAEKSQFEDLEPSIAAIAGSVAFREGK